MSIYYITAKGSNTGVKFNEISKKWDAVYEAQKALANKYGFSEWRRGYWLAYGGISSVRGLKNVDSKIWKKAKEVDADSYTPKRSSKEGKAIYDEFRGLPTISIEELNACIGFEEDLVKCIGFACNNEDYFGFITDEKWNIEVPSDCEEVTYIRYRELFNITKND